MENDVNSSLGYKTNKENAMVQDDDIVIRYVPHKLIHRPENRLSSGFYKTKNKVSVDVLSLIKQAGHDVRTFVLSEIDRRVQAGAVWAWVGEIRRVENFDVHLSTGGNNGPYHAEIISNSGNRRISKPEAVKLLSITVWHIGIPGIRVTKK